MPTGEKIVVVRQLDGGTPQPAQRFTPEAFAEWAAKQTTLAEEVHSCYEAGPCGFVLHRQLLALGIDNLVIRPRDWDEYGQRVKTDRRDARQMAACLERYVTGNREALHPVRVPTPEQEQRRSDSRLRQRLHILLQIHSNVAAIWKTIAHLLARFWSAADRRRCRVIRPREAR